MDRDLLLAERERVIDRLDAEVTRLRDLVKRAHDALGENPQQWSLTERIEALREELGKAYAVVGEIAGQRDRVREERDEMKAERAALTAKLAASTKTCEDYNKRYKEDYSHVLDLWGELWRLADARGDTSTGLVSEVASRGRAYVDGLRAQIDHWRSECAKATAVVEFAHAALSDAGITEGGEDDADLALSYRVHLLATACNDVLANSQKWQMAFDTAANERRHMHLELSTVTRERDEARAEAAALKSTSVREKLRKLHDDYLAACAAIDREGQ